MLNPPLDFLRGIQITGTHHVEDACRRLHIHEPIEKLLKPIFPSDES